MKITSYIIILVGLGLCLMACSQKDEPSSDDNGGNSNNQLVEPKAYNSNRLFIKYGLQLPCWVATDNFELGGKAGQPAYVLNPEDWKLTGFTAPTFFGPPLMNISFFNSFPQSQWSMAKAPYGDHLKRGPHPIEVDEGFLSVDQKKFLNQLVSICFGDEEEFKSEYVTYLQQWYSVTRKFYPDVLVHNNQFANQWSQDNMRMYLKMAKPDMIVYDWYYFHSWDADTYRGSKDMANHLMMYRNLSLEDWNGKGENYIAFGQYSQGFVNEGTYKIKESQLRLYYYMTWTFGGKWLNWFRYLQGDGYGGATAPTDWSLLLDKGMPGHPTKYMDWVRQCNKESKHIGNYLVRLKTTDVRYVLGSKGISDGAPDKAYAFSAQQGFLKSVKAQLVADPTKSGDVYLGYFDIIPASESGDPGFFDNTDASFFMVTNAYTSKLEETAEPLSQQISLSIDMTGFTKKKLSWINPDSGIKEELSVKDTTNGLVTYSVTLSGGSGALLIAE